MLETRTDDLNEPFDFIEQIDADLDDNEKEAIVYEWLFLTSWLNQLTNEEYDTAEDVMDLFFRLYNQIHGTTFEIRSDIYENSFDKQ